MPEWPLPPSTCPTERRPSGRAKRATAPTAGLIVPSAFLLVAYVFYVLKPELPGQIARSLGVLYTLSLKKFYFDEVYDALIVKPLEGLASLTGVADNNGVDAAVNAVGQGTKQVGQAFRPMQNGLVQFYALAMVLGLKVFLLALVRSL